MQGIRMAVNIADDVVSLIGHIQLAPACGYWRALYPAATALRQSFWGVSGACAAIAKALPVGADIGLLRRLEVTPRQHDQFVAARMPQGLDHRHVVLAGVGQRAPGCGWLGADTRKPLRQSLHGFHPAAIAA